MAETATAPAGGLRLVPRRGGEDRDGPVTSLEFALSGCRPGFIGKEDPASAPGFLDFERTSIVLKDLPEAEFRQAIVDTLLAAQDLGLNRNKGTDRANAYLDMVTWDGKFRASWTNDNSIASSSCGMFVRNVLWLCGVRGTPLFDAPYKPTETTGVLSDLLKFEPMAVKGWNKATGFDSKTFFPKIGDAFYLYKQATNSQHIFIITAIDKPIVDVDGVATVYEPGTTTPAGEITFTSVDGGQLDGTGPDATGKSKAWGCQAITLNHRKMTLKEGRFPAVGVGWPMPGKEPGRPIVSWISMWEARGKFTAARIKPIRLGPIGAAGSVGAPVPIAAPIDDSQAPVAFETWPTYTSPVPASILATVKENREALMAGINPPYAFSNFSISSNGEKLHTGYSRIGAKAKPASICTPDEEKDARLKAIFERLEYEMAGEGGVSAVMTGDGVGFTWGRGLGHGGGLEPAFSGFIGKNPGVKKAFFECGITLEEKPKAGGKGTDRTWKIVDTDGNTVQTGNGAIDLLNGTEPAAKKKLLLSIFVKISEDNLQQASQAQWESFKQQFYYGVPPSRSVVDTWEAPAVCYVIHCLAWGKFAGWERFEATGGDLKKILRLEADYTNYHEKKKSGNVDYVLVPYIKGNVTPAPTMLNNMGHDCMKSPDVTVFWKDSAELQRNVRPGDVVFQMGDKNPSYYALEGTSQAFDAGQKYDVWIENHHALAMAALIKELGKLDKTGKKEVLATRDRYVAESNPNKGKWGLRPQIAMEAVIHKDEGIGAAWIFDQFQSAGIAITESNDQYLAVGEAIGLNKYDAWVEKNQAKPMDYLIQEIGKMKYAEIKNTRDWYASPKNLKMEKWGPRPRVALDAVLHKNEGQGAAWILNEAANAGISDSQNRNQYEILKQTLGIA